MSWWLIARTPDDGRCWELGEPSPEDTQDLIDRAKALLGWPHGDNWVRDPEARWALSLAPGEPHETLLAVCPEHDVRELSGVTAAKLKAWRTADATARAKAAEAERLATARSALVDMPAGQLQALLTDLFAPRGKS